jgi:hypothetical protein
LLLAFLRTTQPASRGEAKRAPPAASNPCPSSRQAGPGTALRFDRCFVLPQQVMMEPDAAADRLLMRARSYSSLSHPSGILAAASLHARWADCGNETRDDVQNSGQDAISTIRGAWPSVVNRIPGISWPPACLTLRVNPSPVFGSGDRNIIYPSPPRRPRYRPMSALRLPLAWLQRL